MLSHNPTMAVTPVSHRQENTVRLFQKTRQSRVHTPCKAVLSHQTVESPAIGPHRPTPAHATSTSGVTQRSSAWARGRGWHEAMMLVHLPLAAPTGLSPLHIPTLCGSERVLVVSTEPPDDLSCLTTPGVGGPGDGAVARAVDQVHPDAHSVSKGPQYGRVAVSA